MMVKKNFFSVACDFFSFPAFNSGMKQHPFLTIIETHSAAIDRVCRSFCRTVEDLEDLRQDIIINLWQGWQRYRPQAKTITWVWRVAVNTGISWLRHRHRQIKTIPIEDLEVPEDTMSREDVQYLHELMQQLPKGDRQLLHLYLDGWKLAEIAEMVGLSESNVQNRMARIRQQLRTIAKKNE